MRRATLLLVMLLPVVVIIQGCSGPKRHSAVPASFTDQANVPGMKGVRYRLNIDKDPLLKEGIDSYWKEVAHWENLGKQGPLPPARFLALSGGGDNGAFGAGLLNGWTEAGTRPEFKMVTGVSTGALSAPFAFLGPKYDNKLREFYTNLSPEDIIEGRSIFAAVTSDAMADNKPLWKLVDKEIDRQFLSEIAEEHRKGRLLLCTGFTLLPNVMASILTSPVSRRHLTSPIVKSSTLTTCELCFQRVKIWPGKGIRG